MASLVTAPAAFRRPAVVGATLLALMLGGLGLVSCGSSDPSSAARTKQAVERLHEFGLTSAQAACIVDEVGAEAVVEATDLNALTEGSQYREAADDCTDDG